MVLEAEQWLELRRFRALRQAEVSISEIARETGLNWRTVKKHLEADGPVAPPEPPPRADRRAERGGLPLHPASPLGPQSADECLTWVNRLAAVRLPVVSSGQRWSPRSCG